MKQFFVLGLTVLALSGSGCATRGYARRQAAKVNDQATQAQTQVTAVSDKHDTDVARVNDHVSATDNKLQEAATSSAQANASAAQANATAARADANAAQANANAARDEATVAQAAIGATQAAAIAARADAASARADAAAHHDRPAEQSGRREAAGRAAAGRVCALAGLEG